MILAATCLALAVLAWPVVPARGVRSGAGPEPRAPVPATVEEAAAALGLVAAALRSGIGSVEALECVAAAAGGPAGRELAVVAAAHRWGLPPNDAWAEVGAGWSAAGVAWHAAHEAGAAPAGLVRTASERMRVMESRRVERAAHRAGVLLVLPLGACFLPGFVATTVAPVVLHLLAGLGG